jgi:hypothetical protein
MQTIRFYGAAAPLEQKMEADTINSNRAGTAPDAFASRVHNSYQDYLNLFSFAINKVDESTDGQALVVRFNPLREGSNLFGLTLTAAKPSISEAVKNAIPEATRSATTSSLQQRLGDLSDLTLSGSYSFATAECTTDRSPRSRCWGRTPQAYRDVLFSMTAPIVQSFITSNPNEVLVQTIGERMNNFMPPGASASQTTLAQTKDAAAVRQLAQEQAIAEANVTAAEKAFYTDKHLDRIASLVDNQPQLSITGNYHTPGKYGGPKETSVDLEFQAGQDNINSIRAGCLQHDPNPNCLSDALSKKLQQGISTDKWVLSATYKKVDSFSLNALTLDQPVMGFTPVNLARSTQLAVKGQGGRVLDAQLNGKPIRLDASLEGDRSTQKGLVKANRWVATVTLSMPLGDNVTIPLSLNYGNKADFLGPQNIRFGAHIGLTYRLPMNGPATNGK